MIKITRDFLPVKLIQEIKNYCKSNNVRGLNFTKWDSSIVQTSGPILLYSLSESLTKDVVTNVMSHIPESSDLEPYVSYNVGSRYSYIPWHTDSGHKIALTIYLNEFWDIDWAGAFLYELNGSITAIYPEFNKGVYFEPPLNHCTIMPTIQAPMRESLQIFFD